MNLVREMMTEAKSSENMAREYGFNPELRTQYETEARTWRSAARMVERELPALLDAASSDGFRQAGPNV